MFGHLNCLWWMCIYHISVGRFLTVPLFSGSSRKRWRSWPCWSPRAGCKCLLSRLNWLYVYILLLKNNCDINVFSHRVLQEKEESKDLQVWMDSRYEIAFWWWNIRILQTSDCDSDVLLWPWLNVPLCSSGSAWKPRPSWRIWKTRWWSKCNRGFNPALSIITNHCINTLMVFSVPTHV